MKKAFYLFALMIMVTTAMAQKKSFTLEDLMPGGYNYFNTRPQNKYGLTWWNNQVMDCDVDGIKTVNMKDGTESTVITLEEINTILKTKGLKETHQLYNASFPYKKKLMLLRDKTIQVLIDIEKKEVVWTQQIPEGAENLDWEKNTRALAFTIGNNLIVTTADGYQQQVTTEPDGVVCGQSVHRNEFGINKGTFWSPKGRFLAFYRMDQSMVTDYPQVNTTTRIATPEPDKYPMAGMTSHKVTIGVYCPSTKQTIYLQAGDPTDRYFTNISWSPDDMHIYIQELNRDQNHMKMVCYNAISGEKEKVLFEETHPKYVEPLHPITFLPWNPTEFIYQSQCDGFNHLYIYNTEGKLIKQLTKGEWLVQNLLGFNVKTQEVIYMSTEISPLQTNTYAINVNNGKKRLIGTEEGFHRVQLSPDASYIIDNWESHAVARKIDIIPTSGKGKTVNILTATNPQEEYNMPEITVGTIKAADGKTDLYYRLIKPVNFDSSKKYPAVIYVYGGPHAQMINDVRNYAAGGWDIYMAQLGYVMLTVDNRGSENRGLEFENVTFGQLGTEEMKDQIKGVELLKSLSYVDPNRIGVHGWSFGGFMTTNLMLTYNDIFKVGVAGGPVIDWAYYEVMYGERYMDTPQTNPERYKSSNLKLRAKNLKGRLEIIIGANDKTVVPQHAITFIRACIDSETQPDFFIYPGDEHNMFGRDRVHLYTRITRYFEEHLK
ncbi:S9 family peptidase [Phocaeicola oris]|uniref:S9 family peptidase n=1 Tax=Phocaeicola oris TaxID=2896850 RepID=UPI00234FA89D|nr:DPP IV N-terminal domain-containing protein [Phocaeicola oris]MCE2616722.1 DPP IV N-terminal domain-containing protein [Phocaeicola oris]